LNLMFLTFKMSTRDEILRIEAQRRLLAFTEDKYPHIYALADAVLQPIPLMRCITPECYPNVPKTNEGK